MELFSLEYMHFILVLTKNYKAYLCLSLQLQIVKSYLYIQRLSNNILSFAISIKLTNMPLPYLCHDYSKTSGVPQ